MLTNRKEVKGGFGECTLVPVFCTGEHPNVPSFRFLVPGNILIYPYSGFWYQGTSAKTTLLETTLLRTPERRGYIEAKGAWEKLEPPFGTTVCRLLDPEREKSEVNKRGRPSKWPPECLPSKFADFECAFSL